MQYVSCAAAESRLVCFSREEGRQAGRQLEALCLACAHCTTCMSVAGINAFSRACLPMCLRACLPACLYLQPRPFAFSDPFIMRIGAEETVGQLRQRVLQQLEVPEEEREASWKPVLCT